MKMFCDSLREHSMKLINFKKKNKKLLTKEQQNSNENPKICLIYKEKLENKYLAGKKYRKVRDHCHYTAEYRDDAYSMCNLKYSVPKLWLSWTKLWLSFYDKGVSSKIQKTIYLFRRKHWKINDLYSSNRKRSYKD